MQVLNFSKVRSVKTPTRGTDKSAGLDLYVPDDFKSCFINPQESCLIPSGLKFKIPEGYCLIAFNKSGVCTKKNLSVGANVIDEDYQGETHIHLYNFGDAPAVINPGDKIIQLLLIPAFYFSVVEVQDKNLFDLKTKRGDGKFGSTGNI